MPGNIVFDVAAIDGPLVPAKSTESHKRECEYRFIRGAYALRCKPGLSHFGTGLELRKEAAKTALQFHSVIDGEKPIIPPAQRVMPDRNIVEAFPNAFLGVLLADNVHRTRPKMRRGKKFDWLYQEAVSSRVFDRLLERLQWNNSDLSTKLNQLEPKRFHEEAAALICLLTAACAATQRTEIVGEPFGGWFWMPPLDLWQPWAKEELHTDRPTRRRVNPRDGSLADFFARSPLRGSGLKLPPRSESKEIDLSGEDDRDE